SPKTSYVLRSLTTSNLTPPTHFLRYHDHVTALENDILLQIPAFSNIAIAKRDGMLFSPHSPHNFNIVFRCKWSQSTGEAQRLQHIGVMADQVFARFVPSPNDIHFIT